MRIHEAVEEYLLAARQEGKSKTTIRQYDWHLGRLAAWLQEADVEDLEGVSRSLLRRWGAGLRDGWAPATCRQAVIAARSWLNWSATEGWIGDDLVSALAIPHVPKKVQRTLTIDEVRALLEACDASVRGRRDAALVSLLVDAGLRAAEVCRLPISALDLEAGTLFVAVKGGDQKFGYFGAATARRLGGWLEVRPAAPNVNTVFVSVGGNTPGQPLTTRGLRKALLRLGDSAGVPGASPHAFRRSFACIMTEAGAPGRVVQLAGRWSNISMVERYTASLSASKVVRPYSAVDFLENGAGSLGP